MDMKYYFKMAYFNIIRNKKSVIINIILISIAFTILLTMSSISTSIQSYIDKKVVNTPLHRTLLSEPFMIWEKGLEEEIYRIISNNNRIIEAHEYFMPNLFDVVNSEEIFGETSINKDRIALELHSNSKEISKEIIAGRAIREDTNVAVIPKYFYPDYFNETKFLKDDIEYLNGENYIDKTITVEYYSYDYMDTTFKINRTYNYTFKVIGVYDNVNTLNESYDIYIPYKDMKKIQTNIEQNSNEQTESKQIYALVDNYAHMDTVIEDLKNNNVYFKRQAKVGYIGELARYIYVLGNLLSIFVFGIGGSYIMITTIKAIKNCTMEIGLLKSMGYTNNIIRNIIITNATITSITSMFIGTILTLIILIVLNQLIKVNASIYLVNEEVIINMRWFCLSALLCILLPLIGSVRAIKRSFSITIINTLKKSNMKV